QPAMVEVYDNLSSIPTSSAFYETDVNGLSYLVTVKQAGATRPANGSAFLDGGATDGGAVVLADFQGDDTDPTNKTGLLALADVDEISILCCPDEFTFGPTDKTISQALVDQCELLKYRFAILQAPKNAGAPANNDPSINSKYAAFYYPWLNVI